MNYPLLKSIVTYILIAFTFCISAQSEQRIEGNFNTKKNFVFINGSLGGGDYPFAGLGLTLSRQFFKGKTMAGMSIQYIGNTAVTNEVDWVQVFPVMVDIRQKFMESKDERFAAFVIADAGYVISITHDVDNENGQYKFKNGWGINPGVAFRINVFENVGVMFDITWFHHQHPQLWYSPVVRRTTKIWNTGLVRGNIFF